MRKPYLETRQYKTIGVVGVVNFVLAWGAARSGCRSRLPHRCGPPGLAGYNRYERLGSRERAHGAGGNTVARGRSRHRLQGRCRDGHAGGRTRASRRGCLLRHSDRPLGYDRAAANVIDALVALGFGASLISIFARLGGGIFTKGADVGGDLVGKGGSGVFRKTIRVTRQPSPTTWATTSATAPVWRPTSFETYAVTVVATMVARGDPVRRSAETCCRSMVYPLAICGACIVTSIIGTYFVKLGPNGSIMGALTKASSPRRCCLSAVLWLATQYVLGGYGLVGNAKGLDITGMSLMLCGLVGSA